MIVALFIRNYKVFNGTNFIPVSTEESFTAYFGMNGVGKSSIFQALDTFFNDAPWSIHKSMSRTTQKVSEKTYVMPIFLIKKELFPNKAEYKTLVQKISDYTWNVQKITVCSKEFITFRDELANKYPKDEYYLLPIGKKCDTETIPYFGMFLRDKDFLQIFDITDYIDESLDDETQEEEDQEKETKISLIEGKVSKFLSKKKELINIIKDLYTYMYLPTEINVEEFTKIQNNNMQQLIHRDIKQEIANVITSEKLDSINKSLSNYIADVSDRLGTYNYQKNKGKKEQVEMMDLVNTIIKAYFNNRVLTKIKGSIPVGELSSGEKRKALLDVAVAFLEKKGVDKTVVLAVDEPELSLHISNCFEQFEKLQRICSNNVYVYITTHWYGFLTSCTNGVANFIEEPISFGKSKRSITSFNIHNYNQELNLGKKHKNIPDDIFLKSKFDLIQSIVSSICIEHPYNYLLVEGTSDKTYLETYLSKYYKAKKLRILALGGRDIVVQMTKLLSDTIKNENIKTNAKIIGLIDTDSNDKITKEQKSVTSPVLLMRIRYNEKKQDIVLEKSNNWDDYGPVTSIEDVLDPHLFRKVFKKISSENPLVAESFRNLLSREEPIESKCSRDAFDITVKELSIMKNFFNNQIENEKISLIIDGKPCFKQVKDAFADEYIKMFNERECIKLSVINTIIKVFGF